jgi:hypothetical protein
MSVVSYLATFLGGVALGAAGMYFADKFSDQRRALEKRRAEKRAFDKHARKMPDLFKEMKADLENEKMELVREFFVLSAPGVAVGAPDKHFRYDLSRFEGLAEKIKVLEHEGFILDVSQSRNVPKYWLQENFVTLLRQWKH